MEAVAGSTITTYHFIYPPSVVQRTDAATTAFHASQLDEDRASGLGIGPARAQQYSR